MGCSLSKNLYLNVTNEEQHIVKVNIQEKVGSWAISNSPIVVFIFGGPGSRKGYIIDNLTQTFGFKLISTENIIITKLPAKVSNIRQITSIHDIGKLLKEDSSHASLDWLLSSISQEILKHPKENFLVDILPNLRFLLKLPGFTNDCFKSLRKFEHNMKILFALDLSKQLDDQQENFSTSGDQKMKDTGGKGDEADSLRTMKRVSAYEEMCSNYLNYFHHFEKIIKFDANAPASSLWNKIEEILLLQGFKKKQIHHVINIKLSKNLRNNDDNLIIINSENQLDIQLNKGQAKKINTEMQFLIDEKTLSQLNKKMGQSKAVVKFKENSKDSIHLVTVKNQNLIFPEDWDKDQVCNAVSLLTENCKNKM